MSIAPSHHDHRAPEECHVSRGLKGMFGRGWRQSVSAPDYQRCVVVCVGGGLLCVGGKQFVVFDGANFDGHLALLRSATS